ncbi:MULTISPECIES: ribosome maturation factor RimM [Thermoactinomyces]|uniref:Ribosome maturation factor RimM n=1 Tax=Thermoactinomyces daqus TaxID=1329516 RepID=A0A7W2AJP8_9BACL|nr:MULTISPECIES: ribosome maturation factor RimM [Thermoactinomyces]MBA4544019.1 ribosome maturation factor RimM [Thermoactinomyces daqus]MBH8598163.1 ribosome maturation factor RimM [Thermoactinomyces sp. CICC 10523]MBH8603194.1 ribosome maturation factor RimM [Thermoactinomyces sp. CICC 10522]MBH8606999.1 ribosome maturation factor RimM [Thermoactinomyces sp. CICC 10521]
MGENRLNHRKGGDFGSGYLNVGRIVGTHGIRGEVRVLCDTDFPELRFAPGNRLLLLRSDLNEPLPLTVEKSRPHKSALLVKFQEWNSINEAEVYKNSRLVVPKEDLAPLNEEEGEFYFHQIIGCEVITTEGRKIGKVKEILPLPANDVWVVRSDDQDKEILLPYIEPIVKDVDLQRQQITIQWMEGLD